MPESSFDASGLITTAHYVLSAILGFVAAILNIFLIAAILRSTKLRTSRFAILILFQSIGGCAYGLCNAWRAPVRLAYLDSNETWSEPQCSAAGYTCELGGTFSRWIIMIVAIERVYAVTWPISYSAHGSRLINKLVIAFPFLFTLAWAIAFVDTDPNKRIKIVACNFATCRSPLHYDISNLAQRIPGIAAIAVYFILALSFHLKRHTLRVQPSDFSNNVADSVKRRELAFARLGIKLGLMYGLTSGVSMVVLAVYPSVPAGIGGLLLYVFGVQLGALNVVLDVPVCYYGNSEFRAAVNRLAAAVFCRKITAAEKSNSREMEIRNTESQK